ncbi:MAG: cyclic-di-AMP receptor [Anaerolineae bacterium]|nr:cyclic-di-AMP receptor [Anaerolineae bacterium]
MADPVIDRMVIVIAYQWQSKSLMRCLREHNFTVTIVDGIGGLLREGMVTLVAGLPARRLPSFLALVRDTCPGSTRYIPFDAEMDYPWLPDSELVEVRAGGANVFVLPVERFVQL